MPRFWILETLFSISLLAMAACTTPNEHYKRDAGQVPPRADGQPPMLDLSTKDLARPDHARVDLPRLDQRQPDLRPPDLPGQDLLPPDLPVADLPAADLPAPDLPTHDIGLPTCKDGVKNGTETDVDCGGPICKACGLGEKCKVCDDCDKGACNGGTCKLAPNCLALRKACPGIKDGLHSIDPNGGSPADSFAVFCNMTGAGGGWTHIATTADDGKNTWTTNNRAYLWDKKVFGSTAQLNQDYKSKAYFTVPFNDMAFMDAKGNWAAYAQVNQKAGLTVAAWMPQKLACANAAGRSFKMTAGNLKATKPAKPGKMNSTTIYFSIYDNEGCSCTPGGPYNQNAYGPTWSYMNNSACGADDAGGFGWGPGGAGNNEAGRATLGDKTYAASETKTGDYIRWYVR